MSSEQPVNEDVVAPIETVPETPPPPLTTGQQLRMARESKGMSAHDVADVLRFSTRQVELLEADRYDELLGATLVRGFIRGYAKLLRLDPEPLLAGLTPAATPGPVEIKPPANIGAAEDPDLVDRALGQSVPWGSIVAGTVIVLALGLVAYFVWTSGVGSTGGAPSEPTPSAVAAPQPTTLSAPDAAAPAVPSSADVAAPPFIPLVAEFDDRSWIEVRDVAQKVIFVGEYPKGTRQVIEGKSPFQIWIGKASGVRLTYGDRSIDLKPHTREEVARFTLE